MRFYLSIALLAFSSIILAQVKQSQLIPYRKGTLWGYCDMNKKIKIPVKFEEAYTFGYSSNCCFYEDYAKVKFHGEYYVTNSRGRLEKESTFLDKDKSIDPPMEQIEKMSIADIHEKDGSVTFNGKVIIPANKYKNIAVLEGYNRFFIVSDSNYLSGVIDRNQKMILPLKYHNLVYFFLDEYYDSTLHKLVTPVYFVFREPGAKKVIVAKYQDTIVKQITVQYSKKLKNFIAFGEPDTTFTYNSNWGILDRNLQILVKPKFAEISTEESNDIFLVRIYNYDEKRERQEDKIGFINRKGTEFFE